MKSRIGVVVAYLCWLNVSLGMQGYYFHARTKREELGMAHTFASEEFRWVDTTYTNRDSKFYNYSGYNSFEPIKSELYRLEKQYDFVEVEYYGTTLQNRPLLALHINKNKSGHIVFLNSLIHAREWMVGCVTMNIIHRLLEYNSDSISMLLNSYHFVIVPVVNPDGYEYTFTKNRMWRKNREPTTDPKCIGVDLNRNFMYGFHTYRNSTDRNSEEPCSEAYRGVRPFDTKEASAIRLILLKYRPKIRYYIDYHTYGNYWTNAYGAHNWPPINEAQLKRYRDNAVESLRQSLGVVWEAGSVHNVIYKCNGIIVDYVHNYNIAPIAFTVEVGNEQDNFDPPDTRILTHVISQWWALVSQLTLLKTELDDGQYLRDILAMRQELNREDDR